MRRLGFAIVVALAACQQNSREPASHAIADTIVPVDAGAPVAAGEDARLMKSGVSEEEFRAMHTLAENEPVVLFGKDVVVGGARGYLSLPPGAKPGMPAVIVVHEWWGLNDHIRHWADRLAATGIAALAVDLYGGNVATTTEQAQKYMTSVSPDIAIKTLKAAAEYLKDDPQIKAKKRGVIGWCFGGHWSLETALAVHNLDAAVVYYGFVPTDEKSLKELNTPLLAFFGTQDKSIPKDQVDAFEATLKRLNKDVRIERFDADHAFANPSGDHYNSEASKKAWEQTRAFFAAKLGALQ